jgi:hypothetical protein
MTPQEWARLMRQARAHAALHDHRAKVRAVKLPPTVALYLGVSWVYVLDCPARARDYMPGH